MSNEAMTGMERHKGMTFMKNLFIWLLVLISFPLFLLELLWERLIYGSVPLSSCKDPEIRSRAQVVMWCAVAGITPSRIERKEAK